MAEGDEGAGRDEVRAALDALNAGDPEPVLALCDPEAVLRVGPTPSHPQPRVFYGRAAIRSAWDLLDAEGGPVAVTTVEVLSDLEHLALVVEATLRRQQPRRFIVTGVAGEGGSWRELWLQGDY